MCGCVVMLFACCVVDAVSFACLCGCVCVRVDGLLFCRFVVLLPCCSVALLCCGVSSCCAVVLWLCCCVGLLCCCVVV